MLRLSSRLKTSAIILALLGASVCNLVPCADGAQEPNHGAGIFFPERSYEFGKVIVGETVKHVFTFTNSGDEILEINDVKSTCGCTSSGQWTRQVPPGGHGVIPVEFHTGHFNGSVTKPVTVLSNVKGQREVELTLKGIVWHPIEFVPASAAFSGALETPASLFRIIHITNREDTPLLLGTPKSNHHSISAEVVTNIPGMVYELTVKLVPPLGAGNVFGEVNLPTSSTNLPTLSVPVWAVAQPAVLVLPHQVEIPAGPFTNKLTRSISVRNNGSSPLELSDLQVNFAGIDAKIYEIQKGQFFTIQLLFPETFQRGSVPMKVSFKSNNPKFPLLQVPIVPR